MLIRKYAFLKLSCFSLPALVCYASIYLQSPLRPPGDHNGSPRTIKPHGLHSIPEPKNLVTRALSDHEDSGSQQLASHHRPRSQGWRRRRQLRHQSPHTSEVSPHTSFHPTFVDEHGTNESGHLTLKGLEKLRAQNIFMINKLSKLEDAVARHEDQKMVSRINYHFRTAWQSLVSGNQEEASQHRNLILQDHAARVGLRTVSTTTPTWRSLD